jgi:hypothetical protein
MKILRKKNTFLNDSPFLKEADDITVLDSRQPAADTRKRPPSQISRMKSC